MPDVAATTIEWEDPETGRQRRLAAGSAIPEDFPAESREELTRHDSIMDRLRYQEERAEDDRRRAPVTVPLGMLEDLERGDKGAGDRVREIVRGERSDSVDERGK